MLSIFLSEFLGTAVLLLLGGGVVANHLLPKSKGNGGGWLLINFGWGFAVFAGVYVAYSTGGHLNPAVTIAKVVAYMFDHTVTLGGDVPVTAANVAVYILAQFLGAFAGAVLVWLTYKKHFDENCDSALKLAVFSTGPEIRSYGWNVFTEAIGTAVLIIWVFVSGVTQNANGLGALGVAVIIVGIGISLGGPTGYAINPARDLGPRIAHAILPIKGKGGSDWGYSWVPVVGPIIGAVIATVFVYGLGILGLAS
ncbi:MULTISPECIES: MIP/aquaporin family protein [unclassified Schaalia]|uniref:MIP/aquaporin family protein n=1 Tax=unclassified Schaalia TaxID=2691889 RepID=UPI001E295317|nr:MULTISPECIES: MIP/aquaporin family protein [unclassified Schaalia]MCD4548989.1 aquaporin family protein [Schaalia sp. lx-260]MCD4557600.1 aquaporin family protein [Schaalia sp. lx-100]